MSGQTILRHLQENTFDSIEVQTFSNTLKSHVYFIILDDTKNETNYLFSLIYSVFVSSFCLPW
jgi:hypothetical protein